MLLASSSIASSALAAPPIYSVLREAAAQTVTATGSASTAQANSFSGVSHRRVNEAMPVAQILTPRGTRLLAPQASRTTKL